MPCSQPHTADLGQLSKYKLCFCYKLSSLLKMKTLNRNSNKKLLCFRIHHRGKCSVKESSVNLAAADVN